MTSWYSALFLVNRHRSFFYYLGVYGTCFQGGPLELFLSYLLKLPVPRPFPILSDNQATCFLANSRSPAISARSKLIDICHHFIRDHVQAGSFSTTSTWILDYPLQISLRTFLAKFFLLLCFLATMMFLGFFIPSFLVWSFRPAGGVLGAVGVSHFKLFGKLNPWTSACASSSSRGPLACDRLPGEASSFMAQLSLSLFPDTECTLILYAFYIVAHIIISTLSCAAARV